jgi:hypothetical protein
MDNRTIFIADQSGTLLIYNISNIVHPKYMSATAVLNPAKGVTLSFDETMAYVVVQNLGMVVVNITDRMMPMVLKVMSAPDLG